MVHYVVIGGGVSGVCCAEQLCRCCPDDVITLVTKDQVIKVSTWNVQSGGGANCV